MIKTKTTIQTMLFAAAISPIVMMTPTVALSYIKSTRGATRKCKCRTNLINFPPYRRVFAPYSLAILAHECPRWEAQARSLFPCSNMPRSPTLPSTVASRSIKGLRVNITRARKARRLRRVST